MLHDFHVTNFRAFEDLTVEKLGRVNLIVGRNNVGKTCLLEALEVCLSGMSRDVVLRILRERGELDPSYPEKDDEISKEDFRSIFGRLWHGGAPADTKRDVVFSMDGGRGHQLDGCLGWVVDYHDEPTDAPRFEFTSRLDPLASTIYAVTPALLRRPPNDWKLVVDWRSPKRGGCEPAASVVRVSSHGLDSDRVEVLWKDVELRPGEADVTRALSLLLPGIAVVRPRAAQPKGRASVPMPWARLEDEQEPHPLASYGEGTVRAFHLALGLVNCQGGAFLIDEFENGLHYSVQPAIWKMIFETAQKLDVQVFATTHSWDCIEAFQQAAAESEAEGALIRLDDDWGKVRAVVFGEDRLSVITRGEIEVR